METLFYWGVGLIGIAIILLAVEVFVPSGGLISLAATGLAIVGVVCLFRVDWRWGLSSILVLLILGPTVVYFGLQIFPSTPIGRKLINASSSGPDEPGPGAAVAGEHEALINSEGEAITDLRPGGFVRIEGKRLAALSEVAYIEAGSRVRVTAADGMNLRVRPV